MSWNYNSSKKRIKEAWKDTEDIEIKDLVRDTSLESLSLTLAYRAQGVHAFSAILNSPELLETDQKEGERTHKRYLRYLDRMQRATHLILKNTEAKKVDYQSDRLHFMLYKPYDDPSMRIARAVDIADAHQRFLAKIDPLHSELPDVLTRAGIESGTFLIVRNGTRGDRELLSLGDCVNHAAKHSWGDTPGIYLGPEARRILGEKWYRQDSTSVPLTPEEIELLRNKSGLNIDVNKLVQEYKKDLQLTPISSFHFHRPTPPLRNLKFEKLTPANTARIKVTAILADIDNFTNYVSERMMDDERAKSAIRVLHVVRKELRDVLQADFGGKKVRYIGDCLQGVIAEGVTNTDSANTVRQAVRASAGMRSSFELIQELISDSEGLGLAVGLELGPTSLTRLGVKGSRDRVIVGRCANAAEDCQRACSGKETEIGEEAFNQADEQVREVFKDGRRRPNLDYNTLEEELQIKELEQQRNSPRSVSVPPTILQKAYFRG